jgi:23S rRNA pseudouridine955/2504/2580 synthase
VHRLDKETSGILLIARTGVAAAFLTRAFREKATRKTYWAVVVGRPKLAQGRIDLLLAKMAGLAANASGPPRRRAAAPSLITS